MKSLWGDTLSCLRCCGSGVIEPEVSPSEGPGAAIACTHCRAHELAWQPYYDEQRRYWLAKRARS